MPVLTRKEAKTETQQEVNQETSIANTGTDTQEMHQSEVDRAAEAGRRDTDHGAGSTENVPATTHQGGQGELVVNHNRDINALIDSANQIDGEWASGDYIPQLWIDTDEKEGCIVDSEGNVVVENDGQMQASIIRSHISSKLYELSYEEYQKLLSTDEKAENPIICKSLNGLTPDSDVEHPMCGPYEEGDSPCQKIWDNSKKCFVADCPYKTDGNCVEQTHLLIADYTPPSENVYEDPELMARCIKSDDFSQFYASKELFWLTIGGFLWSTFAPFKKDAARAIKGFNRTKLLPRKVKSAGVLVFTLRAERSKEKDSYGNKRWVYTFSDILPVSDHVGEMHLKVIDCKNAFLGLEKGDEGYSGRISNSYEWAIQALEDVSEYKNELVYTGGGGQDDPDEDIDL